MKNGTRTRLAVLLFVPLAALILGTFACLPAPVGDPAKSKVDDTLTGVWKAVPKDAAADNTETTLAVLRPWDEHTYLMEYFVTDTKKPEELQVMHFKAWLTQFGTATFITCQPMDEIAPLVGLDPEHRFWAVLRLDKTPAGMEVRMINPDNEALKALDKDKATREELEAIIKAHVDDKAFYGDTLTFKKLAKEDRDLIEETLKKFNIKANGG